MSPADRFVLDDLKRDGGIARAKAKRSSFGSKGLVWITCGNRQTVLDPSALRRLARSGHVVMSQCECTVAGDYERPAKSPAVICAPRDTGWIG